MIFDWLAIILIALLTVGSVLMFFGERIKWQFFTKPKLVKQAKQHPKLDISSRFDYHYYSMDGEDVGMFWFMALLVAVSWFVLTLIVGAVIPKTPVYERGALQSINDNTGQQGSFFLGIGGFEQDGKFFYYVNKDGSSKFKNIDADKAEIIEGGSEAFVEERTDCKSSWSWLSECVYFEDYAIFHVPKDTIKTNYKLDAQ